jgi:hypothetical protein
MTLHVLDDNNRVVHDDADREDEAEERQRIERESEAEHHGERADERDRHCDERDDRRAPRLQETPSRRGTTSRIASNSVSTTASIELRDEDVGS